MQFCATLKFRRGYAIITEQRGSGELPEGSVSDVFGQVDQIREVYGSASDLHEKEDDTVNSNKNRVALADRLRVCFFVLVLLIGAAGLSTTGTKQLVFAMIELFVVLAFFCVEYTMNRCPHCNRYLDRNRGQFCQHCAQRVREKDVVT